MQTRYFTLGIAFLMLTGAVGAAEARTRHVHCKGAGTFVDGVETHIDTNGDGRFNDRAPGFTRDSFRTAPNHSLDMRLSWSIKFAERRRAQVLLEAFNVFNRDNVTQVSNVYGPTPGQPLALFGQATAYGPPRQMQLGFRLTY